MNYLAHAYRYLDNAYFVAGTSFPDWMNVLDRKNRARRRYAEEVEHDVDPEIASFAKGCIQHHDDDQWFHQGQEFASLSTEFAVELRELCDASHGHQAGFLAHISVELLLDSTIIEREPTILDDYYNQLSSLNAEKVELAANRICRRPVDNLPWLLRRFMDERFLADYRDDLLLLRRLNGVMRRVGLPKLPPDVAAWLGIARPRVRSAAPALLTQHA